MYRTNTCGELRLGNAGMEVTLSGWVQASRDLGGMTFIDLRDRYGITQLVFNMEEDGALCQQARKLGREFVIQAIGIVRERTSKNPNRPTGDIEIVVKSLKTLNASKVPPFTIEDETDGGEELRMKYRYLDIRRNPVQEKLIFRSRVALETKRRKTLTIEGGWEALSTGEGEDRTIEQLASLALTLKHAPLTFIPDPDTLLAAPRQTHGAATLSSLGPTLAGGGNIEWMPWTEEELKALDYPAFTLRPAQPLTALDAALALARRYPVPGFQADATDLQALPALGESAIALLHKGELAGIPYLTAAATKGWSGETTLESAAELVARSLHPKQPPDPNPKPALWDEITAATGGSLLFRDQLISLLSSLGVTTEAMAAVWHAMLIPQTEESNGARASFTEASGLDAEAAGSLWNALCKHAKLLVTRDAAAAWGRTALWLAALKADHPAAFLAGALSATTARADVTKLASEARRLGIKIEQPDINRSEAGPVLQRDGDAWAILWGLSHLPGLAWLAGCRFLCRAARRRVRFPARSRPRCCRRECFPEPARNANPLRRVRRPWHPRRVHPGPRCHAGGPPGNA